MQKLILSGDPKDRGKQNITVVPFGLFVEIVTMLHERGLLSRDAEQRIAADGGPCPSCGGSGVAGWNDDNEHTCRRCNGTGHIPLPGDGAS